MACPLFLPLSPLGDFEDIYGGACAAQPSATIPVETLRRCCNAGYAREACTHAAQADADAFRFLIRSNRDGVVAVAWSSERDHHPLAVGTFLVTGDDGSNDPLERQARACAAVYLRQSRG
jgi:hypothetical protein